MARQDIYPDRAFFMDENRPKMPQNGRSQLQVRHIAFFEQHFANKELRWSKDVKIAGGHVCRECGESHPKLIESHHIKPRAQFPELQYEPDNGELDCLWLHIYQHRKDLVIQNMILLRLVYVLTERYQKPFSKCQKALFGIK